MTFEEKYKYLSKITCDKLKVKESDYEELNNVYKRMVKVLNNPSISLDPVAFVAECEFRLQEIYNFEKDKDKHSYWYLLLDCTCPKMDNKDYWGTDMKIYSCDCPHHVNKLTKSK